MFCHAHVSIRLRRRVGVIFGILHVRVGKAFEPIRQMRRQRRSSTCAAWFNYVVTPSSLSLRLVYKGTMCSFFISCVAGASIEPFVPSSSGAIVCASYAP